MRDRRMFVSCAEVVREFNEAHPVGSMVRHWKGQRRRQGAAVEGKTRSEAFITDSGHAAVFIEGVSGFVPLTHVAAVLTPEQKAVNEILHKTWDPIGCGVPEDEYEDYIEPTVECARSALAKHPSDREAASQVVADHLADMVAKNIMPRSCAVHERDVLAARRIVALIAGTSP